MKQARRWDEPPGSRAYPPHRTPRTIRRPPIIPWAIIAGELVLGIGAALAVGTGFALVRYWRTGRFPNQDEGEEASVVSAWVKFVLGLAMAVWGFATLDAAGLF